MVSLLTKERKVYIMELLKRDGFVSIKQLMSILNISRSSVMRDLDELEKEGMIFRERGGASLISADSLLSRYNEPGVIEKEHTNENQKRKICKKAASYLNNGDCIYIDSGTTGIYIIDYIMDKEVDIVSPNTYILSRIPDDFKGKVYVLGGEFKKKSEICTGSLTVEMMKNFKFDYAFLTANGISFENGEVYSYHFGYAALKKEALKQSKCSMLLVDQSKFEKSGLCVWANPIQFQAILVDSTSTLKRKPKNVVVCQ